MFSTFGGMLTVSVAWLCSLAMATTGAFWLARRASGSWKRAGRSTTPESREASLAERVLALEVRLQELDVAQVGLSSSLEKVCSQLKTLTSRVGMRTTRSRSDESQSEVPPLGASKAELLRHYGMAGKVGPAFARAQQELELTRRTN